MKTAPAEPSRPIAPAASARIAGLRGEGVLFARTGEGFELPIIDVGHPRFAVPTDPGSAEELYAAFAEAERKRARIPRLVMRFMIRSAAKRSRLMRSMFGVHHGYLDGLSTYVMKLGPDNLVPPYDEPMDLKLATSPHVKLLRLRMQQTATMLAEGLAGELGTAAAGSPLDLVNIGGGPAIDSLNTLMRLQRSHPALLDRPIVIHVLDRDEAGPHFGKAVLEVLCMPGHPLAGRDIRLERMDYDWDRTGPLSDLLQQLAAQGGVVAVSSEGALFEYGSDAAIVANLRSLHAAGVRLVAGSVTRDDETRRRMIEATGFRLVPRGIQGFAPLAEQAGFRIAETENAWLSDQVLLRPT